MESIVIELITIVITAAMAISAYVVLTKAAYKAIDWGFAKAKRIRKQRERERINREYDRKMKEEREKRV